MGIFNNRLVTPSGIPPGTSGSVTDFTMIAMPLNPPSTIPLVSNADFSAMDISAVPIKISRYSLIHGFCLIILFISSPRLFFTSKKYPEN